MRVLQVLTAIAVGLGATSAHAQSRAPVSSSCDLPQASGVSSQKLTSAQRCAYDGARLRRKFG